MLILYIITPSRYLRVIVIPSYVDIKDYYDRESII